VDFTTRRQLGELRKLLTPWSITQAPVPTEEAALHLASFAFLGDGGLREAIRKLWAPFCPILLPKSGALHRRGHRVTSGKLSSSSSTGFPHVR